MSDWNFDFGPPKEDEPDWEELQVDSMAAWILKRVPENHVLTAVRAIVHSYAKSTEEWGSKSMPTTFLRGDIPSLNARFECTVEETEDSSRNNDGPLIRGSIEFYERGVEIAANSLLLTGAPAATMQGLERGSPLSQIIDIDMLKERTIDDIKEADGVFLVSLNPLPPAKWISLFPDWI